MHFVLKHFLAGFIVCCPAIAQADIKQHCQGSGKPLYLIGGGPAFTTWNLTPVQHRLARYYRVCRWDTRGVGDNAGLAITKNKTVLSQWLQDMAMLLPNEPVILWGHSWGALQAMLFAKQFPQRVSQLLLSNPVDPALLSLEYIEQKRFQHPAPEAGLSLDDMGTEREQLHGLRSKIASYFVDAKFGWRYATRFTQRDANNRLNVQIWEEYRAAPLSDQDVHRLSDKISGLIYCQYDVLQPENQMAYRRLLPRARHHVLPACAHYPWEENPQGYYRVLEGLLNHE